MQAFLLVSLIQQAEAGDAFRALVFKSADPDYFISHVDVTRIKGYREAAAKLQSRHYLVTPGAPDKPARVAISQ